MDILDIDQAAEFLRISRDSLYRYARAKIIPATKVGRHWRFSRDELVAWVERRGVPGGIGETPPAATAKAAGPGGRILLVDDDAAVRKLLASWVRLAGCDVVEAGNGTEAVQRIREGGVSLVVLDVHLPDMDAPEVLAEIAGPSCPPVVLITGAAESPVLDAALQRSVVFAMGKPFSQAAFTRAVKFFAPPDRGPAPASGD